MGVPIAAEQFPSLANPQWDRSKSAARRGAQPSRTRFQSAAPVNNRDAFVNLLSLTGLSWTLVACH
jgi:hypothetical protein